MYSIRILKSAAKELEKLDKPAGGRIVQRVRWLSENLDATKLFPLKGELQGLYKLREVPIASSSRLTEMSESSSSMQLVIVGKSTRRDHREIEALSTHRST